MVKAITALWSNNGWPVSGAVLAFLHFCRYNNVEFFTGFLAIKQYVGGYPKKRSWSSRQRTPNFGIILLDG
jgi:hypothetical protein